MGIQGLLPLVKGVTTPCHISSFRRQRIAVDGYAWLHRSAYSCTQELALNETSSKWITFCIRLIDMLLEYDIHVVLVFDGANLPAKSKTDAGRHSSRASNLQLAIEHHQQGNAAQARSHFARSVSITPRMAAQLVAIVRKHRPQVECLVAPFEADAQLAYLSHINYVDCIITEDSDVIPYQCKQMLFKLDKDGNGQLLHYTNLLTSEIPTFDLRTLSPDMITMMCVLSGCDYLNSINGFGLKKSLKYILRYKTPAKLLRALKFEGLMSLVAYGSVSDSQSSQNSSSSSQSCGDKMLYEVEFYKALMTFRHQVVYDPKSKQCVHLTPLPAEATLLTPAFMLEHDTDFLGTVLPHQEARDIANGIIDPVTKDVFAFSEDELNWLPGTTSQQNVKSALMRSNTTGHSGENPNTTQRTRTTTGFKFSMNSGAVAATSTFHSFAYSRSFKSAPATPIPDATPIADLQEDISALYQPRQADKASNAKAVDFSVIQSAMKASQPAYSTPSQLGKRASTSSGATTASSKSSIESFFKRRSTSNVIPLSTKESLRQLNVQNAFKASENLRSTTPTKANLSTSHNTIDAVGSPAKGYETSLSPPAPRSSAIHRFMQYMYSDDEERTKTQSDCKISTKLNMTNGRALPSNKKSPDCITMTANDDAIGCAAGNAIVIEDDSS